MQVDVRGVVHREGNKNGKAWSMDIATVIVSNDDGTEALGEVILPRGHPEVKRGLYSVVLGAIQNQGSVQFVIRSLSPAKVLSKVS